MAVLGRRTSLWMLAVVVCVPVIVTLFTAGRSGLYDDLLVLRTSALLSPVAESVAPAMLGHLDRHGDELQESRRLRYRARVQTLNNYPANSVLVRFAEHLPTISIFQSNILSHSAFKLAAMLALIIAATRLPGSATALCLALLSSLCIGMLPQGHLLNPLGKSGFLWYQAPLRCTAVIWFMALALRAGTIRAADSRAAGWAWMAVLALAGAAMNVGLAAVTLPPLLLGAGLKRLIFPRGNRQTDFRRVAGPFLAAVLLACAGWWAFIVTTGGDYRFGAQRWFIWFWWLACSLGALTLWLRLRANVQEHNPERRNLGDLLLCVMLVLAVLILGLNWIQADKGWMYADMVSFLLVELGTRATGPANGLFLLLVAVMLSCMDMKRIKRFVVWAACVVLVVMPAKYGLVACENWGRTMNGDYLSLTLDDLGQGAAAYDNELRFYAALSNELRAHPDGSSARRYFQSH